MTAMGFAGMTGDSLAPMREAARAPQLAGGAVVHRRIGSGAPRLCDYEAVLKKATRVCSRRFGIHHTTLQVTAVAARGGLAGCGECTV